MITQLKKIIVKKILILQKGLIFIIHVHFNESSKLSLILFKGEVCYAV